MQVNFGNLMGVAAIAFAVPFALGFARRLTVPSIVFEILAGVAVGPAVLGWVQPDQTVMTLGTIGVALLMFLAGMELDLAVLTGKPLTLGSAGFAASLMIAGLLVTPLALADLLPTPALIVITLSATSVGIVVPILRDTGQLHSDAGRFIVASGSVAEFSTIAMLGIFFATNGRSDALGIALLVIVAVFALGLLGLLRAFWRWRAGRRISTRLSETSAQVLVRLAVLIFVASAALATSLGFESILGTFIAGGIFSAIIRGDPAEERLRSKLDGLGFGFLVPVFFVTTGLTLTVSGIAEPAELGRIAFYLIILLLARGLPALLYRRQLPRRQVVAAGLLQATNLTFVVVAVSVGLSSGILSSVAGTSLILAGMASAVGFPALAQRLLGPLAADRDRSVLAEERF